MSDVGLFVAAFSGSWFIMVGQVTMLAEELAGEASHIMLD